ncbi:TetR/AcrR family transcriptional regulator [Paenibacillus hodogayensis]|uniref:TetR/AcrR family transcriptional regulator n=1 Tax=Paenibacillus hodogayensis TaxID=279208 RepID=A0ABV5VY49_9BACL
MKPSRPTARRKPGRPKIGEPSNVKETLLRTASALFMQFGYDSVSLDQIGKAAGVTKASIYYYFPNKSELFTAAVVQMMANIAGLTKRLLDAPGSFRERLIAVTSAHMQTSHVDFESLLREAGSSLSPGQIADIREAERSIHLVLADVFREQIGLGTIRPGDPLLYAYAFSSIMMLGGRRDTGAEAERTPSPFAHLGPGDIVDLFWYGVGHMV